MPANVIRTENAEHYTWGEGCDAWYLVRTPELHVIEERMPPGTAEMPHHHERARQFFYVLEGELTMACGGQVLRINTGEGVEIVPGVVHQARNQSATAVRFLVTSQPPSHADRVDTERG